EEDLTKLVIRRMSGHLRRAKLKKGKSWANRLVQLLAFDVSAMTEFTCQTTAIHPQPRPKTEAVGCAEHTVNVQTPDEEGRAFPPGLLILQTVTGRSHAPSAP